MKSYFRENHQKHIGSERVKKSPSDVGFRVERKAVQERYEQTKTYDLIFFDIQVEYNNIVTTTALMLKTLKNLQHLCCTEFVICFDCEEFLHNKKYILKTYKFSYTRWDYLIPANPASKSQKWENRYVFMEPGYHAGSHEYISSTYRLCRKRS